MFAWADCYGRAVHVFEVATGKERLRLEGHVGTVCSLVFECAGGTGVRPVRGLGVLF